MEYEESLPTLPGEDIVSQLLKKSFAARNVSEQKEKEDQNQLHNLITEKFIEKPRRLNFLYK